MSFQERAKHPIHEHCIKADVLSKEGLKEQTSVAIERRQESCYSKESMMTKNWTVAQWMVRILEKAGLCLQITKV